MNKSYKSIWNEALGTYVAAAETAVASGRKTSSSRRAKRTPLRAGGCMFALEPRIVFDGALAATVLNVESDVSMENGSRSAGVAGWNLAEKMSWNVLAASKDGPNFTSRGKVSDGLIRMVHGSDAVRESHVVVFVDAQAADLADSFMGQANEVVLVDAGQDGLEQMAHYLRGRTDVDAVHVVSHSESGTVRLGTSMLSAESIQGSYQQELAVIRSALSANADILLYGCDVSAQESGLALMRALQSTTGADIAASHDATGSVDFGGDWELETHLGSIEAKSLNAHEWHGILGSNVSITTANVMSTSAGFSVRAFNADGSSGAVSVRSGSPSGFGVQGVASGDTSEIGEVNGRTERLEVTFDGQVTSADVWIAWLASQENATVELYRGSSLVGTWSRSGGTDTVDGPYTIAASGNVAFDRMVFSVPTGNSQTGDDFLVNRIDFVLQRAPIAQPDTFTTTTGTALTGSVFADNGAGVDRDPDGDAITVQGSTQPSHGTVVVNADGSFVYTPTVGFVGTDTFTYTVRDSDGLTSTATVTISVGAVDDAPVAVDDIVSTTQNTPLNGNLASNDTPSGDGGNVWSLASGPANGTVVINADGTFSYTPNANFNGTDSFSYTITDADGDTSTATVTISVGAANDRPVAQDDSAVTEQAQPVSGNVLTNDSDPDGDRLTVTGFQLDTNGDGSQETYLPGQIADIPGVGRLSIEADGSYVFLPVAGFVGMAPPVTYSITDGRDTASATLTLRVLPSEVQPEPPTLPEPPTEPPVEPPTIVLPELPEVVDEPPSGRGRPGDPLVPPGRDNPLPNIKPSPLHILTEVGASQTERMVLSSGAFGDYSLVSETSGSVPEGLALMESQAAYGDSATPKMDSELHVQRAVRHQPVTSEHGLFVQHAVRASQLEARLRDVSINSQTNTAALGVSTLIDAFALGAARPVAEHSPLSPLTVHRQALTVEAQDQLGEVDRQRISVHATPATVDPGATAESSVVPPKSRAATGFRSQLDKVARDRQHGGRPITRATVKA